MGCSSSVAVTSNPQSNAQPIAQLDVDNANNFKDPEEEPSPSSTADFIENSVLVLLIDEPLSKLTDYITELRRVVSALRTFANPDTCYEFLKSIQDEIIFLIISTKYEEFTERTPELQQIYKTYIFDLTTRTNVNDTHDQSSKIQIFRNINALCDQLTNDRELAELDSLSVVTINPSISNATSTRRIGAFLISQYIKVQVISYKVESNAKSPFVDFCRAHYADDSERLCEVDSFDRDYRPKEVLKWLHKSSFVSCILNRLQRVPEIELLYKVGFMMKHMHMQLLNFHDTMNSLMGNTSLILYRGKTMSQDEFNIFNQDVRGSFLSSAAFLIANTNKNLTIDFLRRIITYRPERIGVLFEIHIDPTRGARVPFALLESTGHDIESQSDKYCFTLGAIFRIESFEKSDESSISIWIAKLVMADDNDPQLSQILKQVRSAEALENPAYSFAKLFMDAGYLDRAAKYFFKLVRDKSILRQPSRFVFISCAVGDVLMKKNEFGKAVDYYKKGLHSCLNILKPDHPNLIPIYKSLGECYSMINKYTLALENYEKAAQLMEINDIQSIDPETMNYLDSRISEMKRLVHKSQ